MRAVCGAGGWKARRSNQSFLPVKTEVTLKFHRHPTEVAVPKLLLRADHAPLGKRSSPASARRISNEKRSAPAIGLGNIADAKPMSCRLSGIDHRNLAPWRSVLQRPLRVDCKRACISPLGNNPLAS